MNQWAVVWDEWSGTVWVRRTSEPMKDDEAIEHYQSLMYGSAVSTRNVAVVEVAAAPL